MRTRHPKFNSPDYLSVIREIVDEARKSEGDKTIGGILEAHGMPQGYGTPLKAAMQHYGLINAIFEGEGAYTVSAWSSDVDLRTIGLDEAKAVMDRVLEYFRTRNLASAKRKSEEASVASNMMSTDEATVSFTQEQVDELERVYRGEKNRIANRVVSYRLAFQHYREQNSSLWNRIKNVFNPEKFELWWEN